MYKVIGAQFANYKQTYYYLTDDMSIEVGDFCLVISGNGDPAVVKVNDAAAVDPTGKATKVIMGKIDTSAYFEKMRMIAEREAKQARLEEIARDVLRIEKFKTLADKSEEARQLMIDLGYIPQEIK